MRPAANPIHARPSCGLSENHPWQGIHAVAVAVSDSAGVTITREKYFRPQEGSCGFRTNNDTNGSSIPRNGLKSRAISMKIVFEKIVPEAGSSFAILDKKAAAFDGRFHFHPEVEITLIESSNGRRVVGDSIEQFAPGDLVLLGENLPHQYVSDRTSQSAPARKS